MKLAPRPGNPGHPESIDREFAPIDAYDVTGIILAVEDIVTDEVIGDGFKLENFTEQSDESGRKWSGYAYIGAFIVDELFGQDYPDDVIYVEKRVSSLDDTPWGNAWGVTVTRVHPFEDVDSVYARREAEVYDVGAEGMRLWCRKRTDRILFSKEDGQIVPDSRELELQDAFIAYIDKHEHPDGDDPLESEAFHSRLDEHLHSEAMRIAQEYTAFAAVADPESLMHTMDREELERLKDILIRVKLGGIPVDSDS